MSNIQKNRCIEIICTLGPSSLTERAIKRMAENGVTLFRINLSHIPENRIISTIEFIQKHTSIPLSLDTEGPQVRTGYLKKESVTLIEGDKISLTSEDECSDDSKIPLRPPQAYNAIKIGDIISIDFDSALLVATMIESGEVQCKVISGGKIGSNKAVTVDRHIGLPILSDKDSAAIKILKEMNLKDISLSFVDSKEDVEYVRSLVGADVRIISKIETREAVKNLDEIISVSDALLIDRGDLSREQPINKIPLLQKMIIEHGNRGNKPVFVATNLLESMVKSKKPLRSEVNDIMSTLLSGADGLVLAAETAIGKYPVECVNMVNRVVKYFDIEYAGTNLNDLLQNDSFLLIEPHGGVLVDRFCERYDLENLLNMPRIIVDRRVIMDVEQIGIGSYSPLTGFMTSEELNSVLDNYKLPSGVIWTLPITLAISQEILNDRKIGDRVALEFDEDNEVYAIVTIKDLYKIDLDTVSKKWFGTSDLEHPGVEQLYKNGDTFLGGDIELIKRLPSESKEYEYTPKQTRIIFEHKEWSKVAGFHTRNAVHRAHEYIQKEAISREHLDGVLIHPVVGPKKTGDFLSDSILEGYEIAIKEYYEKENFVLGAFSAYSHYAGPREAVFTAICRKNFGCSHFIVGRDHTGVKSFYSPKASVEIFDKIGDIGIKLIIFDTVYFCKKCATYVEKCEHGDKFIETISGTTGREMFVRNADIPNWFVREKVSEMILEKIKSGKTIFYENR